MNMTVEEIMAQTKAMIQTKQAEFKKRSSETAENPPESVGKMEAVPEEAKKPTPKARADEMDRNVDESKGRTTAGAKHPDTGREQAMDASESALTPEKKPVQSDDAYAKKASAELANDLIASIRAYQKTQVKEAAAPVAPVVAKVEAPVVAKVATEAPANELELTRDVLAKLASLMVATDEGKQLASAVMAKEAGAEAASELIKFVQEKQAAAEYAQGQADAQAAINQQLFNAGYAQAMAKVAAQQGLTAEDQEYVKLGQAIADQSMNDLQGAMG